MLDAGILMDYELRPYKVNSNSRNSTRVSGALNYELFRGPCLHCTSLHTSCPVHTHSVRGHVHVSATADPPLPMVRPSCRLSLRTVHLQDCNQHTACGAQHSHGQVLFIGLIRVRIRVPLDGLLDIPGTFPYRVPCHIWQ